MNRLLATAFVCAVTLAGCGLQQDLSSVPNLGNGPTGPATAITAPTLSGTPYDWASTHGHVVVLDFWGSWCGPCIAEQPALNIVERFLGTLSGMSPDLTRLT